MTTAYFFMMLRYNYSGKEENNSQFNQTILQTPEMGFWKLSKHRKNGKTAMILQCSAYTSQPFDVRLD